MPTTADKLAALEAELAAQRARVEELERKAKLKKWIIAANTACALLRKLR